MLDLTSNFTGILTLEEKESGAEMKTASMNGISCFYYIFLFSFSFFVK